MPSPRKSKSPRKGIGKGQEEQKAKDKSSSPRRNLSPRQVFNNIFKRPKDLRLNSYVPEVQGDKVILKTPTKNEKGFKVSKMLS